VAEIIFTRSTQMSSKQQQQQQQQQTKAQRGPAPVPAKRPRQQRDEPPASPQYQDQQADVSEPQYAPGAVSNPGSSTEDVDAILRNVSATGEGISPSKFVKLAESKHILYDFDQFDPQNVVWSSKVYQNQQGEMYYVNYRYADGVVGPLLVNTCCMRTAKGYQKITDQKTNKVSHIVFGSLEDTEQANAFKSMLTRYDDCSKNLILQKQWCGKKNPSLEEIGNALQPCIMQGMSDQGVAYPPSFKRQVSVDDPRNRTSFFVEPSLIRVPPERLQSTNFFTAVVQFRWVFRKKQGDRKAYPLGFSYSNNVSMTQVVIHADETDDDNVCRVRLPARSLAAAAGAVDADAAVNGAAPPPPPLQPVDAAPLPPASSPNQQQQPADGNDDTAAFNALPSPTFQKRILLSGEPVRDDNDNNNNA
jgi:hypothetical protein